MYQYNQSAILLEKNGRASSGRRTRHINIRYFFVTDNVKDGKLRIEYCPTDEMTGDFNTKPLQGSRFRKHRKDILNLSDDATKIDGVASQECVGLIPVLTPTETVSDDNILFSIYTSNCDQK